MSFLMIPGVKPGINQRFSLHSTSKVKEVRKQREDGRERRRVRVSLMETIKSYWK